MGMKDWKERVTSNRKLATINASAGSRPAMPFGRWPGSEQAPLALASQKFRLQAPALRYRRASAHSYPCTLPAAPQKQAKCDGPQGRCKSSAAGLGKTGKTGSWQLDVAQGHP